MCHTEHEVEYTDLIQLDPEYFDNEEFQADVVDSARGSVDQLMSQVEQYLREHPG